MGRVGMTEVASLPAAVCRIEMDNFIEEEKKEVL